MQIALRLFFLLLHLVVSNPIMIGVHVSCMSLRSAAQVLVQILVLEWIGDFWLIKSLLVRLIFGLHLSRRGHWLVEVGRVRRHLWKSAICSVILSILSALIKAIRAEQNLIMTVIVLPHRLLLLLLILRPSWPVSQRNLVLVSLVPFRRRLWELTQHIALVKAFSRWLLMVIWTLILLSHFIILVVKVMTSWVVDVFDTWGPLALSILQGILVIWLSELFRGISPSQGRIVSDTVCSILIHLWVHWVTFRDPHFRFFGIELAILIVHHLFFRSLDVSLDFWLNIFEIGWLSRYLIRVRLSHVVISLGVVHWLILLLLFNFLIPWLLSDSELLLVWRTVF